MGDDGLEETERSSKMNQVKTVENMMNKDEYKKCIEGLKNSTMFHMSLGSKELFHSNFLHWISIVNWSAFLEIMHGLADTEKFWWEKIDENDPCKCPKDIKVFREHRNFDLSIYILDSEKEVVDNSNNDKAINDENTSEYTQNSKGKRMVQKWIPVLVLENKMKSLPYKAQLEEYTQKAFEEWRKGEKLIKPKINEIKRISKDTEENVSKEWITNHGITFILMSLMDTSFVNSANYINQQILSYKKKGNYSLKFSHKWKCKTYSDLVGYLNRIKLSTFSASVLNQNVLNDYKNFLDALCELAKTWKIITNESYRSQIFPWNVNTPVANEKRQEIEQYKELRIHDIHEKIMYDQLLNLLEKELEEKNIGFERYNVKTNQINYSKGVNVFTNSNYLHGVGIVEVFYVNKDFKLLLQVQGDRYCHMVLKDNIVEKDTAKKKICVNKTKLSSESIEALTKSKYISIDKSDPDFPWKDKDEPSWGQYKENNIYQYVLIPEGAKIEEVIGAMITDLQNIKNWFK